MNKITPFLWFDNNAEEAVQFYVKVFDAKIGRLARFGKDGPGPEGSLMTIEFSLFGQEFIALNGGPVFKFNESVSFVINCDTQDEIDYYWEKLSEGGEKSKCGWLKDKYGLSWQITPVILANLIAVGDGNQSQRVMHAMMQMDKLIIADLENAFERK